jgi:hypothetical protein
VIDKSGDLVAEVFDAMPRHRRLALDPEIAATFIRPDVAPRIIGLPPAPLSAYAVIGKVGIKESYLFVGTSHFIRAAMLAAEGCGCDIPDLHGLYQFQRRREREHRAVSDARDFPELLRLESLVDQKLNGARAKYFATTHSILPERPSAEALRQAVNRFRGSEAERHNLPPARHAVIEFLAVAMVAALTTEERKTATPAGIFNIIPASNVVDVGITVRDITREEDRINAELRRTAREG